MYVRMIILSFLKWKFYINCPLILLRTYSSNTAFKGWGSTQIFVVAILQWHNTRSSAHSERKLLLINKELLRFNPPGL